VVKDKKRPKVKKGCERGNGYSRGGSQFKPRANFNGESREEARLKESRQGRYLTAGVMESGMDASGERQEKDLHHSKRDSGGKAYKRHSLILGPRGWGHKSDAEANDVRKE